MGSITRVNGSPGYRLVTIIFRNTHNVEYCLECGPLNIPSKKHSVCTHNTLATTRTLTHDESEGSRGGQIRKASDCLSISNRVE